MYHCYETELIAELPSYIIRKMKYKMYSDCVRKYRSFCSAPLGKNQKTTYVQGFGDEGVKRKKCVFCFIF